mgnify:CR=1 FL=1
MRFIQIGEWLFDNQAQQLIKDNEAIQLEPISSDLLLCLVLNKDKVVSKDELITHVWKNRIVSDSAITRVISMLRKHLGDDPVKPTYIRTIHKQGYSLVISVEEVSEQELAATQLRGARSVNKYLSFQNGLIFLLVMSFAFLLFPREVEKITDVKAMNNYSITPVISKKGQQRNIVLSHNEKWLLYSHNTKNSKFSNLYIKNLKNGKINQLTHGEFNDIGASFSFDDSEVYFARIVRGKSCKIMRLDLVGFSDNQEKEIVNCNKRLDYNMVSVLPNNQEILFRDFKQPRGFAIYRYHLVNKTYHPVTKPNEKSTIEYHQKLSPDGNWLVVLQVLNSVVDVVVKNLITNTQEVIFSSEAIRSTNIAWSNDSQSVYLIDKQFNQLLNVNIHSAEVKPIALVSKLLSSISHQNAAGEIFAAYGLKSQVDLFSISLDVNPKEHIIIDSSANDYHGVQLSKDKLFFISDRSGFSQFYLRGSDNVDIQLSHFNQHLRFSSINLHPSGKTLVGKAGLRLFTFDIEQKQMTWLSDEENSISSPFYNEQGEIFYLKENKFQHNVYRYIDKKTDEVILEGVGIAQWLKTEQGDEDLFYQKSNGVVYRHNFNTKKTTQETYGIPHPGGQRTWLATNKGIYFLRSGNYDRRGIYFKAFGHKKADLYYSTEPYGVYGLHFDKFNQRFLGEKRDNDMVTKVVKVKVKDKVN